MNSLDPLDTARFRASTRSKVLTESELRIIRSKIIRECPNYNNLVAWRDEERTIIGRRGSTNREVTFELFVLVSDHRLCIPKKYELVTGEDALGNLTMALEGKLTIIHRESFALLVEPRTAAPSGRSG